MAPRWLGLVLTLLVAGQALAAHPVRHHSTPSHHSHSSSQSGSHHHKKPYDVALHPGHISPQERSELHERNRSLLDELNAEAGQIIANFLLQLEDKHETYLKLSSPIKLGHTIRWHLYHGSKEAILAAAAGAGIKVVADSLYALNTSDNRHDTSPEAKAAEARWHKKDPEAKVPYPEQATTFISEDAVRAQRGANEQQARTLSRGASKRVLKLLDALQKTRNYIRLHGAIQQGHVVDYELINGSRSQVKNAGHAVGLLVTDTSISTEGKTTPGKDPNEGVAFDPVPLPENDPCYKGC